MSEKKFIMSYYVLCLMSYYYVLCTFDPDRDNKIDEGLKDMDTNGLSLRKASEKHGISKFALERHKKSRRSVGRPVSITAEDEKMISQLADDVAEWGFPVGRFEVTMMVKDLLDKRGDKVFKNNNIPGDDWYHNSVQRNNMSERLAANIRVARAKVDKHTIDIFYDKLEASGIHEIPPENVFNYDETNFQNKHWKVLGRCEKREETCRKSER